MTERHQIAGHPVGPGHPCFVIAEAGVNHNGDLDLALRLVDAAAEAGADAIKFQTFRTEALVTASAPKADYQARTTGAEEPQAAMLKRLELDLASHARLQAHARSRGLLFLSTPFEADSADLLESLELPAFKIPSGELTNLPFLAHVARKGRPIILSTGMARLGEVEAALDTLREAGSPPVWLLHCVSAYPTPPAEANLRAMATLAQAFHLPVGYSDHTEGIALSLAAVALGACILEKHFTLNRNLPGPDQRASLEPGEFADLVQGIRAVEAGLGSGLKAPSPSEADTARIARKSLLAARDLAPGTCLSLDCIAIKRPGTGLSPTLLPQLLGRTLKVALPAEAMIRLEDLA